MQRETQINRPNVKSDCATASFFNVILLNTFIHTFSFVTSYHFLFLKQLKFYSGRDNTQNIRFFIFRQLHRTDNQKEIFIISFEKV